MAGKMKAIGATRREGTAGTDVLMAQLELVLPV